MAAIAEGRIFRRLAEAEIQRLLFRHFKLQGLQAGAFVRAIAKGLVRAATTGAPPMGASFDFKSERFCSSGDRLFRHGHRLSDARDLSISPDDLRMGDVIWAAVRDQLLCRSRETNGITSSTPVG